MTKPLTALLSAALVLCALVTVLGLFTIWFPALDILNNGLPLWTAASLILLLAAFALRRRELAFAAGLLLIFNVMVLTNGSRGAAPEAPEDAPRLLRIVSFNLWGQNREADRIERYLADKDPDVIVFVEDANLAKPLQQRLKANWPYRSGDSGIVIFSKFPVEGDARIDRPHFPSWNSLIVRAANFTVKGVPLQVVAVHTTRPFYPDLLKQDLTALIQFIVHNPGPKIVAGDFNMTPWTHNLRAFEQITGLKRANTFVPTWPLHVHNVPLLPLFPIDHIFLSPEFAKIGFEAGPRLGSDHRPVMADIALRPMVPNSGPATSGPDIPRPAPQGAHQD